MTKSPCHFSADPMEKKNPFSSSHIFIYIWPWIYTTTLNNWIPIILCCDFITTTLINGCEITSTRLHTNVYNASCCCHYTLHITNDFVYGDKEAWRQRQQRCACQAFSASEIVELMEMTPSRKFLFYFTFYNIILAMMTPRRDQNGVVETENITIHFIHFGNICKWDFPVRN